jgi:hypothetical protein
VKSPCIQRAPRAPLASKYRVCAALMPPAAPAARALVIPLQNFGITPKL